MPRHAKAVLLLAILLIVGLFAPLPRAEARWTGCVGDFMHAPAFALFAVIAHRVLRTRVRSSLLRSALATWALLAILGAGSEVIQHFVGRSMSFRDFLADIAGATAGVLYELGRARASRAARGALHALAAAVILAVWIHPALVLVDCRRQAAEFPRLSSFERPLELGRWQGAECRLRRVRGHATDGDWALRVDLSPGVYPGVGSPSLPLDWTGYEELVFDAELDDGPPLDCVLKIEDRGGTQETEDRFERVVRLAPGANRIRVALAEVAAAPRDRELDLRRIGLVQLFTVRPARSRTIYLDNVHLR